MAPAQRGDDLLRRLDGDGRRCARPACGDKDGLVRCASEVAGGLRDFATTGFQPTFKSCFCSNSGA